MICKRLTFKKVSELLSKILGVIKPDNQTYGHKWIQETVNMNSYPGRRVLSVPLKFLRQYVFTNTNRRIGKQINKAKIVK